MHTTVELTLRRHSAGSLTVDVRVTSDDSAAATMLASGVPIILDETALLEAAGDPISYGTLLSAQLFADVRLREAWLKACAYAAKESFQFRLNLDASDEALHALRWETLCDPESGLPIALHERVRLVRTLDSADLTPVVIPPRPNLRALVMVANPSNLGEFGLVNVDVAGEIARARAALGDIPTTILATDADVDRRATLANLTAALRDGPSIVILVAHGTFTEGKPILWLEQDNGTAAQVAGGEFVDAIRRLTSRPLLLVLASCQSAGHGYDGTLGALGPRLADIGIPAVLAFQGNVVMSTMETLLPTLITELRRDGQIDRSLAAARAALGERQPWWQPVLWLRTDGQLWQETSLTNGQVWTGNATAVIQRSLSNQPPDFHGQYERLRPFYISPDSVYSRVKVERFTGRKWLRAKIDYFLQTHDRGYFILEAAAGLGKTAFMAHLVKERSYVHLFSEQVRGQDGIAPGLRSLATQLVSAWNLNPYFVDGMLSGAVVRPDTLDNLLTDAASQRDKLAPGTKIILVIDALDEAGTPPGQNVLGLPRALPHGVYILVSRRPVPVTLIIEPPKARVQLEAEDPSNLEDMKAFLMDAGSGVMVTRLLQEAGYSHQHFVTTLLDKCRGVWIYLYYVVSEIERGERLPLSLEDLPEGLWAYYAQYWWRQREFDRGQWDNLLLPVISTLGVLQEDVDQQTLRTLAGVALEPSTLWRLLHERWLGFLTITPLPNHEPAAYTYRLYHASMRDFLEGRVSLEAMNNFSAEERAFIAELTTMSQLAHQRIATRYLELWGGLSAKLPQLEEPTIRVVDGGYGLRHLVAHLGGARQVAAIHQLLCVQHTSVNNSTSVRAVETTWVDRLLKRQRIQTVAEQRTSQRLAWYVAHDLEGDLAGFLTDVGYAWSLAEDAEAVGAASERGQALGLQCRYALVSASIRSIATGLQPDYVALLLEYDIWPPAKALSYAQQIPEDAARLAMLVALTPKLQGELFAEAQGAAVATIQLMRDVSDSAPCQTRDLPNPRRPSSRRLSAFRGYRRPHPLCSRFR